MVLNPFPLVFLPFRNLMRGNELVKKTPFVIIVLNHAILAIQQDQENPATLYGTACSLENSFLFLGIFFVNIRILKCI